MGKRYRRTHGANLSAIDPAHAIKPPQASSIHRVARGPAPYGTTRCRFFMIASISSISRGAVLSLSNPVCVIK